MKRIPFLAIILVFCISSSVLAFEWSYSFVVWDGKEYEVKIEEMIVESEIGKKIGKVKTQPYYYSDRSDAMKYYGNASNVYPIGTEYFEIKGISPSTAIAVKVDNEWIKADYVRNAPYHIMNTLTNLLYIVPAFIIILFIIFRVKKMRQMKPS